MHNNNDNISGFYLLPKKEYADLMQQLTEIKTIVLNHLNKEITIPDWITELEAQELLGLKTTTLWALRKVGTLKSSKIGARTFYSLESIKELLNQNQR